MEFRARRPGEASEPDGLIGASSGESQSRVIRSALVGYGYWGPQLARNLDHLTGSALAHIVDLSEERRAAAREEFPHISVTATLDEALEGDAEALVIATPIRTHFALASQALERGMHVFVEKPMAATIAEAEALVALAQRARRVLMVGHTFMYNPAVEELRRLVESGTLGRLYHVDAIRVNLGLFHPDINVLWDLAPQDLSILSYVLGQQPLRVSAHGGAFVRPGVHDVAHLMLHYPDGLLAHIHLSWLNPSKVRRFTIVGDRRMAVYDDIEATEKIRIYNRRVEAPDHTATFGEFQLSYRYGDIVSPHIHWAEPLAVECRHFLEAVRHGTPPRSDGHDGLRIVRLLDAMQRSMDTGGTIIELPQAHPRAGENVKYERLPG